MKFKTIFSLAIVAAFAVACATNPFTGKRTLALVPNSQIFPMAFQQYDQFLGESKVVKGTADARMITNVGQKIAAASERYLSANGYAGYLSNYKWEYTLIDDPSVNAWAMPGGKIAFYTGILPITQGEAGVAAVMGHEVAHALANHGQQRMSAGQINQLAAVGVSVASASSENAAIYNQAYGLASNVGVILPFSRNHESEADKIGLTLMAIAGYDPIEAADLWRRMQANAGGNAPPEFLSTHPSSTTRINNITAWAADAKAEARKFGVTSFKK
ncbi:M48 family metallopeptidase [Rasiella sp. SM2506]|uniref:M48 family metallopeptidase n=1 Tax=Rasiella sp. SM2506 TaxID=3423914 RepID=UPI003D7ADAEF